MITHLAQLCMLAYIVQLCLLAHLVQLSLLAHLVQCVCLHKFPFASAQKQLGIIGVLVHLIQICMLAPLACTHCQLLAASKSLLCRNWHSFSDRAGTVTDHCLCHTAGRHGGDSSHVGVQPPLHPLHR